MPADTRSSYVAINGKRIENYKAISNLVHSKTRQDNTNYISDLSHSYSLNAKVKGHICLLLHSVIQESMSLMTLKRLPFSISILIQCSQLKIMKICHIYMSQPTYFHPTLIDTITFHQKMSVKNQLLYSVIRPVVLTAFQYNC